MLQCNKSPGLDANEIIRLTSAIGQEWTSAFSGKCFSERPVSDHEAALRDPQSRNAIDNCNIVLSFGVRDCSR